MAADQLELIGRPAFVLSPAPGRAEPRLWVRRLVVWEAPGVVRREVKLQPGLNLVWSPDPVDRGETGHAPGAALGHGGGKTLFCRFLRYCLGEQGLASDDERARIRSELSEGLVGAEVIVDGAPWAVVRSIGQRRRNVAVSGGDLEALAARGGVGGGLEDYLDALESVLSPEAVSRLKAIRIGRPWLVALAILARDQACRLADVLAWRESGSGSRSPVHALERTASLEVLRTLIGALSPEELRLRRQHTELRTLLNGQKREGGHRAWSIDRRRERLASALGVQPSMVPDGRLGVEYLRQVTRVHFAKIALGPTDVGAGLPETRERLAEARHRAMAVAKVLAGVESEIRELEKALPDHRGELGALTTERFRAATPHCDICGVPIDRALAEGCPLSRELPDLEAVQKRWQARRDHVDAEERRLRDGRRRRLELEGDSAAAEGAVDALQAQVAALERAQDERAEAWYSARRLVDDVERLGAAVDEREKVAERTRSTLGEMARARDRLASHRAEQEQFLRRLNEAFHALVETIAGRGATGRITLQARSLRAAIDQGGRSRATAIGTLEVVLFDLAVLCMSIEGSSHLPGFLVHDSPREADLGLSAYHRLFTWAASLEAAGPAPLFQYIVTTTTAPPDALRSERWCRLKLSCAPPEERFLKCDL